MTKKALVPFQAVSFIPTGLTGATAASRWVGATASGAPASGTFIAGDFVIAQNGHIFICTVGGSPGTWVDSGSSGAVTSVAGRTGAVVLTAADIGAGTFPGANSFAGLQTFSAGVTVPSGQPMVTGTRTVVTGTRSTTTNASDTVNLGTFSTTGGALELRIHAHLAAPAAGTTASVTKVYELAMGALMGTVSTWYLCLPADASANSAASNDFALEVQRTGAGTFVFRFRQKTIGIAGVITFTAETLGDTVVTFASSTTVTAAPTAVTTAHPSNSFVAAAGNVGIGTDAPAVLLDIAGGTARAGALNLIASTGGSAGANVHSDGTDLYLEANTGVVRLRPVAGATTGQATLDSTGVMVATAYSAAGLTGATAGARFGGGTASGAPTTGTWVTGDVVADQSGTVWVCTAGGTPGTWASPPKSADVQVFSASGTWTKPTGAKTVEVVVVGAGGGGVGGTTAASGGAARIGGPAGAGGALMFGVFQAADLTPTVAVTVGTGGTGSAGSTTSAAGASGGIGGTSSFGSHLTAGGGSGGSWQGSTSTGGCGGGWGSSATALLAGGMLVSSSAGASNVSGGGGMGGSGVGGDAEWGGGAGGGGGGSGATPQAGGSALFGAAGGGCGGSLTSGNAAIAPAAGGASPSLVSGGGGAAGVGTGGAAGTAGAAQVDIFHGGSGGGGGSGNVLTNSIGGAGGAGGSPGGGGGGGGPGTGTISPAKGGAGGNGANGQVVVITHF